jgi:hypothetical protein
VEIQAWDTVFIRATRHALHPVVADVAGWGRWWPGLTVSNAVLELSAPGFTARRRRWTAQLGRERPGLGITLRYTGDVAGQAEFYYLDERAGTVVHYLLRGAVADRGWRWAVRDHRAGVRAGLHALKDRFEAGRRPGEEPAPQLLADQRRAQVAFAEGVAAGARRRSARATRR